MRRVDPVALALAMLLVLAGPAAAGRARAQDLPGLAQARAVARCIHEQDVHIQRLLQLVEQAEQRARTTGIAEDVRRDALASIEALVDRIRQHAQTARHCIEQNPIPVRVDAQVVEREPADPSEESLADERGTVHEVESGTLLGDGVRVVRAERVDGTGSAPDESVRAAMRAIGSRLARCYEQYLDRGARRSAEIHLSFTAGDGGRVGSAQVEPGGALDATMRQCVERAARDLRIAGQRGRSVYAYTIRFGDD